MVGPSGAWPGPNPAESVPGCEVTLALPVIPGQSEAYRRFVQELQGTRHDAFVAACRRWGVVGLSLWLAPHRPGDVVLARLALEADLGDFEARLAASVDPFDWWIKARLRELHGVDLRYGVSRYLVEALGQWLGPIPCG